MENDMFYRMIDKTRREYLIHRVMENSEMRPNGCREWISTRNNGGYGIISFTMERQAKRHVIPASRALYMAYHNVILTHNQYVCHKCDNPSCVEIIHLFVGTPKENNDDCSNKGRKAKKYKEHKRVRVFTDDEIIDIRTAIGSLRDVSEKYGVSVSYISKLRNNKAKNLV